MATLRQLTITVVTQRGEPISYRELTNALWAVFPKHREQMVSLYESERNARTEQRIRLGILVS